MNNKFFLILFLTTSLTTQAVFDDLVLKVHPLANRLAKDDSIRVFEQKDMIKVREQNQYGIFILHGTLTALSDGDFSLAYGNRTIKLSELNNLLSTQTSGIHTNNGTRKVCWSELDPSLLLPPAKLNELIQDMVRFRDAFEQSFIGSSYVVLDDPRQIRYAQYRLEDLSKHKGINLDDSQKANIAQSQEFFTQFMAKNESLRMIWLRRSQATVAGIAAITALIGTGAYFLFKSRKDDKVVQKEHATPH